MYICICNGLTDREARSKSNSSFYSVAEFYRAMGVKPKCGKCIPAVREILESAAGGNGTGPGSRELASPAEFIAPPACPAAH
jgi:bacterioferritin-associated ferredoxin